MENKKITCFEDLIIWQKTQDIAVRAYFIAENNEFIKKDFSLKDQLKSSAISISDNIAEGFEYNNNPDYYKYLRISKGSCGELRNKLLFIKKVKYVSDKEADQLSMELKILGNQIGELLKLVKEKILSEKNRKK